MVLEKWRVIYSIFTSWIYLERHVRKISYVTICNEWLDVQQNMDEYTKWQNDSRRNNGLSREKYLSQETFSNIPSSTSVIDKNIYTMNVQIYTIQVD